MQRADRWRARVLAWETSGLSQAAFCRREGVSVHTFRWWRYALGLQARSGARQDRGETPAPPFVEVTLTQSGDRRIGQLAVEVPGGAVVWVRPGFNPATLKEILSVLGARAC